jgi:hypothetical protein
LVLLEALGVKGDAAAFAQAPLALAAFLILPSWPQEWVGNLVSLQTYGLMSRLASLGLAGETGVTLLGALAAGALVWRLRGQAVSLDRAALVLALTVLMATAPFFYIAVYCLPALACGPATGRSPTWLQRWAGSAG